MKNILILLLLIASVSCVETNKEVKYYRVEKTANQIAVEVFNDMKPPVILIAKAKFLGMYGVTLQDGDGVVYQFGDLISIANSLGESYEVRDTVKFTIKK